MSRRHTDTALQQPRVAALQRHIKAAGGGMLISRIHNVRYLTGFSGSSGYALLNRDHAVFVTDFRYKEQAAQEVAGWDIVITNRMMLQELRRLVKQYGIDALLVEGSLSCEAYQALSKFTTVAIGKPLSEELRAVKSGDELALIREATHRAEAAFREIKPHIKVGASELQISRRLAEAMLAAGCRRPAFDIIVASGPNSSKPHAGAVDRKMQPGDLVVIDWGGEAGGYYSDMTRTLLLSGGSDVAKKKHIYSLVLQANKKGIASVRAGCEARDIDAAARDVIKDAGYGEYFGHGLGHGIGCEVHEAPRISARQRTRITEGMIFTIEPGIYIPGLGGVRIEDMVAVNGAGGVDVFTSLPKKLETI